ncbi:MAG: aldehyde dehydrogenase [Sulfobacillus benefaciens]|uniref:Aldehyde dehydrogenase n=1 Tax=Sulfobacillus benefaciens TaxID=453960 RepID=A0A2T2XCI7_9FIRM|nr:MAG: aldehyde dehydrogenase [Sulfobacillus benefaciens]
MDRYGFFINGEETVAQRYYVVQHKYRQEPLAEVGEASTDDLNYALESATRAFKNSWPVFDRYRVLENAAELLGQQAEDFARTIAQEAGKPIKDARVEVSRGQQTLRYSALAARTLKGSEIPIGGNPGAENRLAFTIRKPYGVTLAITPFNFPLNLVLHKVGPALAAGNPVVLKPAPAAPITSLKLARLLNQAGVPKGWVNVVTGQGPEIGEQLVKDSRVKLITFTGSAAVGQIIRAQAALKPVLLELGNNSANIVHEDADLDLAARTLAARAYGYAGQVCIAVQRIYVHQKIWEPFRDAMVQATEKLVVGDPEDPATDVGPMINEAAADRADLWYREAVAAGAKTLVQGSRRGVVVPPILLEQVAPSMRVMSEEVFAPLAGLVPYEDVNQAFDWANQSRYGLQAGIFTQNLTVAMQAARKLEVGGVMVNDSSSYRADNMPYGGIKDSGIGREGPEFAIEEMTYPTVIVLNL